MQSIESRLHQSANRIGFALLGGSLMKQVPQIFLGVGVVVVLLLIVFLIYIYREPNTSTEQNLVSGAPIDATVQAEREILLQLTDQPDAALSITPYYAEILFNEAERYVTSATPTIDPSQPTPDCWLVADFWQLPDIAQNINRVLEQRDFQSSTEVFVSVVWNADKCDTYIPVSNRVRLWVEDDDLVSIDDDNLLTILNEVASSIRSANSEDISSAESNVEITVNFVSGERSSYLSTNLAEYNEILQNDLQPHEIISLLGGMVERK